MISRKVRQGEVAVYFSMVKGLILLQVTDSEGEQARSVLTKQDALDIAQALTDRANSLKKSMGHRLFIGISGDDQQGIVELFREHDPRPDTPVHVSFRELVGTVEIVLEEKTTLVRLRGGRYACEQRIPVTNPPADSGGDVPTDTKDPTGDPAARAGSPKYHGDECGG